MPTSEQDSYVITLRDIRTDARALESGGIVEVIEY